MYEELWASYQVKVIESERVLREVYNQVRAGQVNVDRSGMEAIRRRLLLVEKGAVGTALRKGIVSEESVQRYVKSIDEKLLDLDD